MILRIPVGLHSAGLPCNVPLSCHLSTSELVAAIGVATLRRRAMEIAGFLMCVAVIVGVLQQFDATGGRQA